MMSDASSLPPFTAPYAPDDDLIAARLLETARPDAAQEARIDRTATRLIEAIRATGDRLGGVEDMLREFALSTKEGLALMVLAEALLRVPDARTADQFIEDKLGQGDFVHHETDPARSWSMRRPGRSACRRACCSPAKPRRARSGGSPSVSAHRPCAPPPGRRCG
jgi:hypothetical protein